MPIATGCDTPRTASSLDLPRWTRRLRTTVERGRCPYHARTIRVAESFAATQADPWRVRRVALATAHVFDTLPLRIRRGEILVGWHPNTPLTGKLRAGYDEAVRYLHTQQYFVPASEGHCAPDYARLLHDGLGAVESDLLHRLQAAPGLEAADIEQEVFYEAALTSVQALQRLIRRYADHAEALAQDAGGAWGTELRDSATVCRRIADSPPRTLREALQLAWFLLLGLALEAGESHHCYIAGRMDQYLLPYYQRELDMRVFDQQQLEVLLDQYFIKLNEFEGASMSAMSLSLGGRTADGRDATNPLSFEMLAAGDRVRMYFPGLCLHYTSDTPPALMQRGVELLRNGKGQPAFFNSDLIIKGLVKRGVPYHDAVDHLPSTCTETSIQGCSWPWVAYPYMNLPLALVHALFGGMNPVTEQPQAPATPIPHDWPELMEALHRQTVHLAEQALRQGVQDQIVAAQQRPFPLLSSLVRGCVEKGCDIAAGGALYSFLQPELVGLPTVIDSLGVIKTLVVDEQLYTLDDFRQAIRDDFEGHPELLKQIRRCPQHGDDQPELNSLFAEIAGWWCDALEDKTNALGGPVLPGFLGWTSWIYMGEQTPATPDGRRAGRPIANSFSPQGTATHGTPAMLLSTTAFDQSRGLGGITFNLRFAHGALATDAGAAKLQALLETGFQLGIFQVQVNVVGVDILRQAQQQPEAFRDLFVRIGGYLVPFTLLPPLAQNEVIQRAELPL